MDIITLRTADPGRIRRIMQRANAAVFDPGVMEHVRGMVEQVRARGDEAILEATARYDRVSLTADRLMVSGDEVAEARRKVDDGVQQALLTAIERTRRYNERLRPPAMWLEELEEGLTVGGKVTPVDSAGVYIPAAKGALPSTCVTIVTPAVMAGVPEIAVVVPPREDGTVDPAILVAADMLGVTRVFRCNGVAGIAGLAFGTATLPRVSKIVGPGNPYVVAAQLAVQAHGADLLALLGPTEAVILADHTADPRRAALDLLSEAEHGRDSAALLVTTSEAVARETAGYVDALLPRLPAARREFAEGALRQYGAILVTDDMDEAVTFVNAYAPEHLMVATADPFAVVQRIRNAGEIALGQDTPFPTADYAIGVPAALPTGGFARSASGVTILSFLKFTSVAHLDRRGLEKVRPVVERLGNYEGFPAHVMAVTDR